MVKLVKSVYLLCPSGFYFFATVQLSLTGYWKGVNLLGKSRRIYPDLVKIYEIYNFLKPTYENLWKNKQLKFEHNPLFTVILIFEDYQTTQNIWNVLTREILNKVKAWTDFEVLYMF